MCDRWPLFCEPWQTNLWAFWQQPPKHDDDDLVSGPKPCSNLRCVSSRPWPFHGDRLVLLGMDTMLHGNLRKFSLHEFSIDRLGKRWWTPICRHCHPKRIRCCNGERKRRHKWKSLVFNPAHAAPLHTFDGSSNGCSIIAWRRNTLPRHARHNIRSKAGKRSRKITPATKLHVEITMR